MSGDRSSTEPEPEGSNPGPEARAEELPRQPGGISAWFNSGPKPPADDAAQGRLEDVDSWNGASGDTALDDERSDSSGVPVVAAARGGATADRTGEGRRVVQVRILDGEEPDQVSSSSDRDDAQPEQGVTPDQKPTFLTWAELVAARLPGAARRGAFQVRQLPHPGSRRGHGLHRWNGAQVPGRHQARRAAGHCRRLRTSSSNRRPGDSRTFGQR